MVLIAGEQVVPELVQHDFTAANVVARLQEILLDGPSRSRMLDGLGKVRPGCAHRKARWKLWSKLRQPAAPRLFCRSEIGDRRRVARPQIHASDVDN